MRPTRLPAICEKLDATRTSAPVATGCPCMGISLNEGSAINGIEPIATRRARAICFVSIASRVSRGRQETRVPQLPLPRAQASLPFSIAWSCMKLATDLLNDRRTRRAVLATGEDLARIRQSGVDRRRIEGEAQSEAQARIKGAGGEGGAL